MITGSYQVKIIYSYFLPSPLFLFSLNKRYVMLYHDLCYNVVKMIYDSITSILFRVKSQTLMKNFFKKNSLFSIV